MNFYNKYKFFIFAGVIVFLLILFFSHTKPRYVGNPRNQENIDSAERRIKDSVERYKYYRILDSLYGKKLDTIEKKIEQVRKNKTEIRNIYIPRIEEVKTYTPTQIDTFLKNRYQYR